MNKHIAVYTRVSTAKQSIESQKPDLQAYLQGQPETKVIWYEDQYTGTTMDRPGWLELYGQIKLGQVSKLVVWRLDRLGRTASGLINLFDELNQAGVEFVSVKDHIDLSTPAGRLIAHVLASVAAFETEVRGERVRAGILAARAKGKKWGGWQLGKRRKVTPYLIARVKELTLRKITVAEIARLLHLSRPTVYTILREQQASPATQKRASHPTEPSRLAHHRDHSRAIYRQELKGPVVSVSDPKFPGALGGDTDEPAVPSSPPLPPFPAYIPDSAQS